MKTKNNKRLFFSVNFLFLSLFVIGTVHADSLYDAGILGFASNDQSMWGTGNAFSKAESVFVGTEWSNKTANIGGIAGSQYEQITPYIPSVQITPYIGPKLLKPATPALIILGEVIIPATPAVYSPAIPATYSPAIPATFADTRTGAQLAITSSGKVGLEFGYTIDSGSVDSTLDFSATADLPDLVRAAEYVNINTSSIFDDGTIDTQSPKIEAYISAILEMSGSVNAEACAFTFGCVSGGTNLPTIDLDQRILSIDPSSLKILDGVLPGDQPLASVPIVDNLSLSVAGGATVAPPAVGFKLSGPGGVELVSTLPPTPSLSVDLAKLSVNVPEITTSGSKSPAGDLTSSGRDDLLSAQIDIDGAASLLAGLPPAGFNVDLIDKGGFKLGATLDIIDVDAGPVLGITQDFELTPTLMTSIAFSNPIAISGLTGLYSSWTGRWSDLPDFALFETTTFTPNFWIDAMLDNVLGLDFGLKGTFDLLKLSATGTVGGINLLNIGPISLNSLLGFSNSLFETDKLGFSIFDNNFSLEGFNKILGQPFTLAVDTLNPVPEPGTMLLFTGGLLLLMYSRGRKKITSPGRINVG